MTGGDATALFTDGLIDDAGPLHDTGPAAHLGFLLGARHSHLDNAGYSVDQKEMLKGNVTPERLVDMLPLSTLLTAVFCALMPAAEPLNRPTEASTIP